jgi:hypothetical protein
MKISGFFIHICKANNEYPLNLLDENKGLVKEARKKKKKIELKKIYLLRI